MSTTATSPDAPQTPSAAALVMPVELMHAQGRQTLAALEQTLGAKRSGSVVLDGSKLKRFDSTALAVVLECRRVAQSQGRSFSVRDLPAHLQELARLYGVESLLKDAGNAESA